MMYPWPPKQLNPNGRYHWATKARMAKQYKNDCYWIAKGAGLKGPDGAVELAIKFHPPDRRRRDMDNMLASIKSGIDGIALALGVDDSNFVYTLSVGEIKKGGGIAITLENK